MLSRGPVSPPMPGEVIGWKVGDKPGFKGMGHFICALTGVHSATHLDGPSVSLTCAWTDGRGHTHKDHDEEKALLSLPPPQDARGRILVPQGQSSLRKLAGPFTS